MKIYRGDVGRRSTPDVVEGGHRRTGVRAEAERGQRLRKTIIETCTENAGRIGMDRRQFLASSMGMTTSLWVLNYVAACSSSESKPASTSQPAYCVPKEAMFDRACANAVVKRNGQFVFDVETHWFDKADLASFPAYIQAFGPLFDVATEDAYVQTFFCESDTTVTCLTPLPGVVCTPSRATGCGFPLSNDHIFQSRDRINGIAGNSQRVLGHVLVLPQDPSGIDAQLRVMEEYFCNHGAAAFELYPGFAPGFRLDDENGQKVFEKGLELGLKLFCVHKGAPIGNFFGTATNYPSDVGPTALKYPDAKLVVYHSAIFAGHTQTPGDMAPPEGPFDPNDPNPSGVNALIKSVLDAGLAPGPAMNVYGETGRAYSSLMNDPVQALHFFGKLMKYLGTDNVCWGSDALASSVGPQQQIETFRALEIPADNEWKYPPLGGSTPEGQLNQDKILGLNAAKLYGVDPDTRRCEVSTCPTAKREEPRDPSLGRRPASV